MPTVADRGRFPHPDCLPSCFCTCLAMPTRRSQRAIPTPRLPAKLFFTDCFLHVLSDAHSQTEGDSHTPTACQAVFLTEAIPPEQMLCPPRVCVPPLFRTMSTLCLSVARLAATTMGYKNKLKKLGLRPSCTVQLDDGMDVLDHDFCLGLISSSDLDPEKRHIARCQPLGCGERHGWTCCCGGV